ncbi:MAG TPA: ABC transporter ATP-binding protein [bacterium]|nr:ABC transporter ATP-binding protein [bacterium]
MSEKPAGGDIICQRVTKVYTIKDVETHALRGVDLTVKQGEFTAIAGPSGSGKTTLLNLIGGLDQPTSGTIHLDGLEISALPQGRLSEIRLRKMGFVFQAYNLIPVLSGLENVEYILLLQGLSAKERRARAEAILTEVGLGDIMNKRPMEMSGGQQQRVAVARAIVHEPELVLADEPTANLDSKTAEGLLHLMLVLNQKKSCTFLFSTHDARVMEHARRLVSIRDGKVDADEIKK